jgi:hypothetical protein
MASEQHNHRIEHLNGNNYITWSEEMKSLLCCKGLWRLVDGKEPQRWCQGTGVLGHQTEHGCWRAYVQSHARPTSSHLS